MSKADSPTGEMLTTEDVARRLRVKPETVQDYVRSGRLRSVKPGRRYLFHHDWVEEFLAQEPRVIDRKTMVAKRLRDTM